MLMIELMNLNTYDDVLRQNTKLKAISEIDG